MTKYAIERNDGQISIMKLLDGELSDAVANWQGVHPDWKIKSINEIADDQLPSDRAFRGAWRHCEENGIRHCLPTARNILRDRMRSRRAERFEHMRASVDRAILERRDASALSDWAQELRDVTKHDDIEAAQNVEDLKQVWPAALEQPVPPLGDVRIPGEAATYDTKALEEWGKSVTEKINQAATMRDLQEVLSKLDAKLESANDLSQRLERLETVVPEIARAADFILKEARGPAELTQEELT